MGCLKSQSLHTQSPANLRQEMCVIGCGFVALLLCVFPQIPVGLKVLFPAALFCLIARPALLRNHFVLAMGVYAIYTVIIGLMVLLFGASGSWMDALYPFRDFVGVVFIAGYFSFASFHGLMKFLVAWQFMSCLGIWLDWKFGAAYSLLPFPIFSPDYLEFVVGRNSSFSNYRLGGFTFEAGVAGGVICINVFLNLMVLIALALKKVLLNQSKVVLCSVANLVLACITLPVVQTKTWLLVLGCGMAGLIAFSILAGSKRLKIFALLVLSLSLISVAAGCLPLAKLFPESRTMEYLTTEVEQLENLYDNDWSFQENEGSGTNVRLESAKVALYGLVYHPLGVGITSGYEWFVPIRHLITPPPEMQAAHDRDNYTGLKGAIWNIIQRSGVVGLIIVAFLFLLPLRVIHSCDGKIYWLATGVALITLGVSVELLPFWEIVCLSAITLTKLSTTLDDGELCDAG